MIERKRGGEKIAKENYKLCGKMDIKAQLFVTVCVCVCVYCSSVSIVQVCLPDRLMLSLFLPTTTTPPFTHYVIVEWHHSMCLNKLSLCFIENFHKFWIHLGGY
ncbi:unnamed protein product [Mucor circinelloides]